MNLPVEVVDAVRAGRCVIFWGSRGSMEAAEAADRPYSEAKDLAKELGWRKPKPVPGAKAKVVTPSVEEGASIVEQQRGRPGLLALLRETVGCDGVAPVAGQLGVIRRFPLVFTTCWDDLLERAAAAQGLRLDVVARGDRIPDADPARRVLVKLRGGFERPETMVVTAADHAARALSPDARKQLRSVLRSSVVLFVGFRPDEEEFERLWAELSDAYGGELPRCHLAVPQGPIDDFLWQKWVWRGLLMFTADPSECVAELEAPG